MIDPADISPELREKIETLVSLVRVLFEATEHLGAVATRCAGWAEGAGYPYGRPDLLAAAKAKLAATLADLGALKVEWDKVTAP